jgi:hypothetical protein
MTSWDEPLTRWVAQERDPGTDAGVYLAWMEQCRATEPVTDPGEVERLRREAGYLPRLRWWQRRAARCAELGGIGGSVTAAHAPAPAPVVVSVHVADLPRQGTRTDTVAGPRVIGAGR